MGCALPWRHGSHCAEEGTVSGTTGLSGTHLEPKWDVSDPCFRCVVLQDPSFILLQEEGEGMGRCSMVLAVLPLLTGAALKRPRGLLQTPYVHMFK